MNWKAFFVGDVMIRQADQVSLSRELLSLIQEHQLVSCNFEAPVLTAGAKPILKAGPHIFQDEHAAIFLKSCGFNVFNLANNHIFDYGPESLAKTLDLLSGQLTIGAGLSAAEAYKIGEFQVGDLKIGLVSLAEWGFGAISDLSSGQGGYAWINHPHINRMVLQAKKKYDMLIVQAHAGVEDIDIPMGQWRSRYQELIDLGVDLVIGHHPHVPQGWEKYQQGLIFYSLGNFLFDYPGTALLSNKGVALSLEFKGKELLGFQLIPTLYENCQVGLFQDPGFAQHLADLNLLLQQKDYNGLCVRESLRLWEEYYLTYYSDAVGSLKYKKSFMRYLKALAKNLVKPKRSRAEDVLLLHNIRIESHRYCVENALEYLINK